MPAKPGLHVVLSGVISSGLATRLGALFTHPFMHRRECMSVFHRWFCWQSELLASGGVRMPPDIREELLLASLLLGVASANIRWPFSPYLFCSDATPSSGGA